ncbi:Xaa-Pro aminopeptidase [Rhizobiales bacterium GAS191]|nr:Xaa-Pro aminopeptidase [Rhizobiales bacterium GAS191]
MAFLGSATRNYRFGLMREMMDREGFDALAFTQGDFFQFATNFHTDVQPWERPILCVVPRNGEPFAILNELSTNHWRFSLEAQHLWVTDAEFYAEYPRLHRRVPLASQWAEMAADRLKRAGLNRSRIGVDAGGGPLARVPGLLPQLRIETATQECRKLRMVKNEEEIALMREIASLSDWVQERYRENIRPGRLVQELDMAMAALMAEESARRFPGDNLEILRCWTLSGPASCAPHGDGRSSGARIEKGHGMVNIVIPRLNGLVVENERTWFCGKPSQRQAELFEAARAANEAACEAAVTGEPVCGIDTAAQLVLERAGVAELILHRTGHGMGLLGHEFPEDMAFNTRPLMEREVYSAEPGIYQWGLGGFRHDDTVVVGEKPEILTKAPKDLASQTVG